MLALQHQPAPRRSPMSRHPELYQWNDTLTSRFPKLPTTFVWLLALWTLGRRLARRGRRNRGLPLPAPPAGPKGEPPAPAAARVLPGKGRKGGRPPRPQAARLRRQRLLRPAAGLDPVAPGLPAAGAGPG